MNRTTGTIAVMIACVAVLLAGTVFAAAAGRERAAAVFAAEHWLALVDQGMYTASWSEAAESLRSSETRDAWVHLLHTDREPAGAVISRTVKRSVSRIGPLGRENVEIWYETSFRNMKSAVERVYTRQGEDGQWRVTGYVITSDQPGLASILMALLLAAVVAGIWIMEMRSDQRLLSGSRTSPFARQDGPEA